MTERIIENWLTKATERTYQLPFCYMLTGQGHVVLHLTRHCGMEHGKDVISLDQSGTPCCFQLKSVSTPRYSLKDWDKDINQLYKLIITPLTHPGVKPGTRHRSFLVVNADIDEEVSHAIHRLNEDWQLQGLHHRLEVFSKSNLLTMALAIKDQLIPTEASDFRSLLNFILEEGNGFIDKAEFARILQNVLIVDEPSKRDLERRVSSAAVLCALALQQYSNKDNHIAIVEGWTIYVMQLLGAAHTYQISPNKYLSALKLAIDIIMQTLENLLDEVLSGDRLFAEQGFHEFFVYRTRATLVCGLLAGLGLIIPDDDNTKGIHDQIAEVLERHQQHIYYWGEGAVGYHLAICWFRIKQQDLDLANQMIQSSIDEIVVSMGHPSYLSSVYEGPDQTIALQFSGEAPQGFQTDSYILGPIVELAARLDQRAVVAKHWDFLSRCHFHRYHPENPQDFYNWNNGHNGTIQTTFFPVTGSWQQMKEAAFLIKSENVPIELQRHQNLLPLLFMVYPHRLNRDLVLFYHNHLNKDLKRP